MIAVACAELGWDSCARQPRARRPARCAAPAPARDCSGSELPAPFCHRSVLAGPRDMDRYTMGVADELREGVRPVLGLRPAPLQFELFDPLHESSILAAAAGPFASTSNASHATFAD